MRTLFTYIGLFTCFCITNNLIGQTSSSLSQDIALGLAELRADIFNRKEVYTNRINEILSAIDTSSMDDVNKKFLYQFIEQDLKTGGKSNSLFLYDQLPKKSPLRNIYFEQYVANNQDYQVDKDLMLALTIAGIFNKENRIDAQKLKALKKEFEFLDISENDRLLLYNAWGSEYALLLGYCFERIDLTIHNEFIDLHYLSLDRIDRYPNINNGNVVEFIHKEDARLTVKGEQWDKIIIRETKFLEKSPGYKLNSFHDNLTTDGYLYLLHEVDGEGSECNNHLDESQIIKITQRADFQLIDQLKIDCMTFFKFKSVKNLNE